MKQTLDQYRILALGEIIQFRHITHDHFFGVNVRKKHSNGWYRKGVLFSLPLFFKLRKAIRNGQFDIILAGSNPFPLYLHDRSVFKNIRNFLHRLFFDFPAFGLSMLPVMLRGSNIPLAIINNEDKPRIPKEDFPLMRRSSAYFMRELPQDKALLYLNANKRSNAMESIRDNPFYRRMNEKIYPMSLGIADAVAQQACASCKDIDVFFMGDINSTVREDGLRIMKKLADEGYRVVRPENRLPFDEFYNYCSRSWLVWSPNGRGWDCFRHYEASMAGSVPVINYPSILRHRPLMDHEHCLYYGVEDEHLYTVIKKALSDKDRLSRMGQMARAHCLRHHTTSKLLSYVIETTLAHAGRRSDENLNR